MIKQIFDTFSYTASRILAVTDTTGVDKYADVNNSGIFSAERWEMSGQMLLIGMLMVFVVLAVLWGIITVFGLVFHKKEKSAEKSAESADVAPVADQATAEAEEDTDNVRLAAIITAAIAATISEDEQLSEQFASGFRVVSFNRSTNNNRK